MAEPTTALVHEVRTLARPASGTLLAARTVIQQTPGLRAIFERARQDGLTAEQLALAIQPSLEAGLEDSQGVADVARYLADEFFQIGDGVLVIDRNTGHALARITEADIWQPPPVAREGTTQLATPLPRLRPDLEAFLVSYVHDTDRDRKLLAWARRRYPQTLALQQAGEPGLRIFTRTGRRALVEELEGLLPTFLREVRGACLNFMGSFPVVKEPPPGLQALPPATAVAYSSLNVADPTTFNPRFNMRTSSGLRIGTAWVCRIAEQVASLAPAPTPIAVEDLATRHVQKMWLVPPSWGATFLPLAVTMIPVETPHAVGFTGRVGAVQPTAYRIESREVGSKWTVIASMDYVLYLDPSKLQSLQVTGIQDAPPTEIV